MPQVINHTPYKAPHGKTDAAWISVADALNLHPFFSRAKVDSTGVRNKFAALVKTFRSEEQQSLRASGTEEEFDELIQLLTGTVEDMDSHTSTKKEIKSAEETKKQKVQDEGERLRESAMEGLTGGLASSEGPRKKVKTADDTNSILSSLSSLQDKREQARAAKVELESERIQMEQREQAHRHEMERRRMDIEEERSKREQQREQVGMQERAQTMQMMAALLEAFKTISQK